MRLLDPVEDEWRIDEATRRVGLAGVAAARAALRSSRPAAEADATTPAAA